MKTLKVKIKNVYGKELVYPVCQDAKIFAQLSGALTLSDGARLLIKSLGYKLEQVLEEKTTL